MSVISASLYGEPLAGLSPSQWFERAALLYPLAPGYQRRQLKHLLSTNTGDTTAKRHLGYLARACLLINRHQTPQQTLSQLTLHPLYQRAAETLARVIFNYQQYDALEPSHLPYPPLSASVLPATLVRALLTWPEDDTRLVQAIQALQQRPRLAETLCLYATSYTQQRHAVPLKTALLLIGPQRSRELTLLAHLESTLFCQQFPLRHALLERRRLLSHVIQSLALRSNVQLPCRAELLSSLMLVDAWRHPRWTNAADWQEDPRHPINNINRWLYSPTPLHTSLAARLCQYWQLPSSLYELFCGNHKTPLSAIKDASVAAVSLANSAQPNQIPEWLAPIITELNYHSPLTRSLRP